MHCEDSDLFPPDVFVNNDVSFQHESFHIIRTKLPYMKMIKL